ncbi:hypothetical protein J8L70_03485 [Pseudoalteromonas sp. MMG010]|uniref:hypothetical protein n=1 Tax=Pseudoalteromonas sp. MMG010 TaxID=2822685 RepID=UPI001B3A0911|nr:hypothetical protein [Pseudoalteromonas sp. MMG010]MBQ4832295.1 hypothetical protein [Pseudoalteromonas sp. MMG010]
MLFILLATLGLIINHKWYLPFVNGYVSTVYCQTPFGYSGVSVLWYSLFVGLPLLASLIIGVFTIPIGYKGLIEQQFPPQGMKVYRPTKIQRGWKGKVKSLSHLFIPLFFVSFAIWGYFQVDKMPHNVPDNFDYRVCNTPITD